MPQYDPQRSHPRRPVSDAEPVPVDALLEPHPSAPDLPDGVGVEHVEDELVVHTADADIEIIPSVDEVIVHTADADLYIDTTPDTEVDSGPTPLRLVAVLAAIVALVGLLVLLVRRRRR